MQRTGNGRDAATASSPFVCLGLNTAACGDGTAMDDSDSLARRPRPGCFAGADTPLAIVAAMQAHPSAADVALWGCRLLNSSAADHPTGQQASVDANAPAAIVEAIIAHADADVALWGCRALGSIAASFAPGQLAVVAAGAPGAIVAAMRLHSSSIDVSLWGCCSLEAITADHPAGQHAAVDAGAPAVIVASMRAHPGFADVELWGCRSLGNIAAFFHHGRLALLVAEAPAAILAALRKHTYSHSTDALASMADDEATLTTAGDVPVTAKSSVSPLTAAVCQWGTLALVRFAQVLHPVPREAAATATMMSSTERAASLARAVAVFIETVKWRLRTTAVYTDFGRDGSEPRTLISVGCDADVQFARDIARECGLHPLPPHIMIYVSPSVMPSILSLVECPNARHDCNLTMQITVSEIRRLLPFVSIEHRWPMEQSTVASAATEIRVMAPFQAVVVTHAVVCSVVERLQSCSLAIAVWGTAEVHAEFPASSDVLHALCRGAQLAGVMAPHDSDLPPKERLPPVNRPHVIASSVSSYITERSGITHLITTGHKLPTTGCERAHCGTEILSYVGHTDPLQKQDAVFYYFASPLAIVSSPAVADIALFLVPGKCVTAANFDSSRFADMSSPEVVRALDAHDTLITCPFPRGVGVYQTRGISIRTASPIGPQIDHVVFVAQHVSGECIIAGDSGGPSYPSLDRPHMLPHSFVHSAVLSAPYDVCVAALQSEFDDGILVHYMREHPECIYGCFTPAAFVLAQAASILTRNRTTLVHLSDIAYTTTPVNSVIPQRFCCQCLVS